MSRIGDAQWYREFYGSVIRTAFWAGISVGVPIGSMATLAVWIIFYSK